MLSGTQVSPYGFRLMHSISRPRQRRGHRRLIGLQVRHCSVPALSTYFTWGLKLHIVVGIQSAAAVAQKEIFSSIRVSVTVFSSHQFVLTRTSGLFLFYSA